jgi:hypothetical protein
MKNVRLVIPILLLGAGVMTSCIDKCTKCEYTYRNPFPGGSKIKVVEPKTCGNSKDLENYKKKIKEEAKRFPEASEVVCTDTDND